MCQNIPIEKTGVKLKPLEEQLKQGKPLTLTTEEAKEIFPEWFDDDDE